MIFSRKKESEKTLEARLVEEVRRRGGICLKLTSQFHRGMPDRLVLLPYHTIAFVELKSTGEKPRALQEVAMGQLRAMHFSTKVVDSTESLDDLLAQLDERLNTQELESLEYNARKNAAIKAAKRRALEEHRAEVFARKTEHKLNK